MKNLLILILLTFSHPLWAQSHQSSTIRFIELEPGVKLELVDWGGQGQPLLFLAGLGNTAHVFDNFAHHFTKEFRVYGLTRRGYGASSQPKYGYDIPSLVKDIKGVLDTLKIEKVSLIGHSIAGDEMTEFAAQFPHRVHKLIYLDAAYDRSNFVELMQKAPYPPQAQPIMTAADSSSSLQVSAYLSRIFGLDYPESEVKATRIFGKEGKLQGAVTPDRIGIKIILSLQEPAYEKVKCPALGVFAVFNHVNELFPNYHIFDHQNKLMAHQAMEVLRPYLLNQIQVFINEVDQGQVVKFSGADHFIFLTHEREVVSEMLEFLNKP